MRIHPEDTLYRQLRGKRFSADIKVTDMLYDCYGAAEREEDFTEKLAAIKARYQEIIDGLGLKFSLDADFEVIQKNFAAKMRFRLCCFPW